MLDYVSGFGKSLSRSGGECKFLPVYFNTPFSSCFTKKGKKTLTIMKIPSRFAQTLDREQILIELDELYRFHTLFTQFERVRVRASVLVSGVKVRVGMLANLSVSGSVWE